MSQREKSKPLTNGDKSIHPRRNELGRYSIGLTKREHFAGLALQGIFASNMELDMNQMIRDLLGTPEVLETAAFTQPEMILARFAVKYADELLAVLEEE